MSGTRPLQRLRSLSASLALLLAIAVGVVLPAAPADATFPGSDGRLAFTRDRSGTTDAYFLRKGSFHRLTLGFNITRLSWSPRGNQLVFSATGPEGDSEIFALVRGAIENLTEDPAEDIDPDWSPDGTKLVFVSNRGGSYQVYTMNADGSAVIQVGVQDVGAAWPKWSPDGSRIAFGGCGFIYPGICIMNVDGSQETLVADRAQMPDWSPDGSEIVYSCDLQIGGYAICVMNPDTYEFRILAVNGFNQQYLAPVYSPDGARVAFVKYLADFDIYVMNSIDGSDLIDITHDVAHDNVPAWQPSH
jgi:Tol biopolymer transport system component